MIKILTIIGARPQFIKAAMVSRAIVERNRRGENPTVAEEIIHTGQHYDINMSDVFFRQMQIPEPVVNLNAGTGMHGEMTGRMMAAIEREIISRKPDWVLVYGDTNSTLAGALVAAKLHVPVAHVEAGLRSFNKRMPEEVNRILTDHVSSLLFCPTHAAVDNLSKEGITSGVHHVGDVMYDAALVFGEIAAHSSTILHDLDLTPGQYYLATVHRAENTDNPDRLRNIINAFNVLEDTVILPLHPRTRKILQRVFPSFLSPHSSLRIVDPVSFLDMVELEKSARCILTDSGGVQKEAYFHGVPCVTLREETEWVETVEAGWNQVVGTDPEKIIVAVRQARAGTPIDEYGQGNSASNVLQLIKNIKS
nr:UDP-N-acetylglucosamine 2-epimerase (non-hydrolyzing) [Syntrophorhabdus aromaticivorans]